MPTCAWWPRQISYGERRAHPDNDLSMRPRKRPPLLPYLQNFMSNAPSHPPTRRTDETIVLSARRRAYEGATLMGSNRKRQDLLSDDVCLRSSRPWPPRSTRRSREAVRRPPCDTPRSSGFASLGTLRRAQTRVAKSRTQPADVCDQSIIASFKTTPNRKLSYSGLLLIITGSHSKNLARIGSAKLSPRGTRLGQKIKLPRASA